MGVLSQLGLGLAKTRDGLLGTIRRLLPGSRTITPELCEELEAARVGAVSKPIPSNDAEAGGETPPLHVKMASRLQRPSRGGPACQDA